MIVKIVTSVKRSLFLCVRDFLNVKGLIELFNIHKKQAYCQKQYACLLYNAYLFQE